MPQGKKSKKTKPKLKTKLKSMQDEMLDRLDHIENVLEDHAQCGIRNDTQIHALEEAICPQVAARLTALERSQKALTEHIENFKKQPAEVAGVAAKSLESAMVRTAKMIEAIRKETGIIFSRSYAERIQQIVFQHA